MISPSAQKRRICFASDPVSATADAAARLMRSPTPYPKELRVLARYARFIQANGQTEYVHVEGLQNGQVDTNGVEIKEARVTANTPMAAALAAAPTDDQHHLSQPAQYDDDAHDDIEARCYDELSRYADPQAIQSQPLMTPLNQRSHIHATLSPLLGDDEMDARAAFFYATAEQKIITPVPQMMDYENVSLCSSSVNPATLARFPGMDHHQLGSTHDRPSNEQASLFGDGSLSSAMGVNGHNADRQYYSNNGTGTRSPAMLPNPNQYYPYIEPHAQGINQMESVYGTTQLTNNHNGGHTNNGPGEDVYYAASQASGDYSQTLWNNAALSNNGDRLSMTSDYARSDLSSVNNMQTISANRQPPPYHIARAFTKKSKTDLQHYEHYRHQNGTIIGGPAESDDAQCITNGHNNDDNHSETDQAQLYHNGQAAHLEQTEFHENFVNLSQEPAAYQPQRIMSPRIADVQQLDAPPPTNGSASPSRRSPNGMDSNLNPDSDSPASSVQSQSTTQSTQQQRNGKSPWLFGYHKNPKVMQLSVPKTLDVGFTLSQPTGGAPGIFVGDVDVNSIVNTMLRRHDKVLDMDGVDFTRIALPDALTVLSNAGPLINMMISRI